MSQGIKASECIGTVKLEPGLVEEVRSVEEVAETEVTMVRRARTRIRSVLPIFEVSCSEVMVSDLEYRRS